MYDNKLISGLSELFNLASVTAGVVRLGLTYEERALAVVVRNEEPDVRLAHLDAVLVPLDLGVRIVNLALELKLLLGDAVLALLELLCETEFRIFGCKD